MTGPFLQAPPGEAGAERIWRDESSGMRTGKPFRTKSSGTAHVPGGRFRTPGDFSHSRQGRTFGA